MNQALIGKKRKYFYHSVLFAIKVLQSPSGTITVNGTLINDNRMYDNESVILSSE